MATNRRKPRDGSFGWEKSHGRHKFLGVVVEPRSRFPRDIKVEGLNSALTSASKFFQDAV